MQKHLRTHLFCLQVRFFFSFTLLCALFALPPDLPAQAVVRSGQMLPSGPPLPDPAGPDAFQAKGLLQNHGFSPRPQGDPSPDNARVNTVSPLLLGRSSNAYSGLRGQQNQVYANDSLNEVVFIHRQDVSIWGGGTVNNGMFRYDVSINGGQSFTPDIGVINPLYSRQGRYPQVTGYNPGAGTNPLQTKAVYTGPTVLNNMWNGYVGGAADVSTNQSPVTSETYFNSGNGYLPGGLCPGLPGEFWMVDHLFNQANSTLLDTIRVYKGSWNTSMQTVDWVNHVDIVPNWNLSFNGNVMAIAPNISFSPDGQTGWIALLGDLVGGADSVFNPIFIKSTDAGATWGAPQEVDLGSNAWVYDSLRTLWVDSMMNPVSSGRATCTFEFDLVVDSAGNPHLAAVVGSASTTSNPLPTYSVYAGLAKFLVDVTSLNGGTNFLARQIAPVLTFRGNYGGTNQISLDNCPQISRSTDGDYIFYAWADSDTAQFTGSMAGVGFGESINLAPNLMTAATRISDGFQTCYRGITNGDLTWDGRALRPTMSPEVLEEGVLGGVCYKMPIVCMEMILNDPNQAVAYHYFGNDAGYATADFVNPASLNLAWNNACLFNFTNCNPVPTFNEISGEVYTDANGNGVRDPGELSISGHLVQANPGQWLALTDQSGAYAMQVPAGNFTVSTNLPLYHGQTVPVNPFTYAVNFPNLGNTVNARDFGMQPQPNLDDLEVSMSHHIALPGPPLRHYLRVKNHGTTAQTPTLSYTHDTLFTFGSAIPAPTSYNAPTQTATWNLALLPPGQDITLSVDLITPPTAMPGTPTKYYASVNIPPNEQSPANNQDSVDSQVFSAFDPNDKRVDPQGIGPQGAIAGTEWLEYTIRFQNTGNAPASLVFIRDTLDAKLDLNTFQTLGASHPHQLTVNGTGNLEWRFPNINLPDSATNFAASQGQVRFRIKPKPGLQTGTALRNEAAIYFDFNVPVITNATLNTIDHLLGIEEVILPGVKVQVYPNPFTRETTLLLDHTPEGVYEFRLYNVEGRLLRSETGLTGDRYVLKRGDLPAGIYIFDLRAQGAVLGRGKVMVD